MSRHGLSSSLLVSSLGLSLLACSDDKDKNGRPANLPLIKPIVQEAAPAGLQTGLVSTAVQGLSERFFNAAGGPTSINRLLTDVDNVLTEINSRTADRERACQSVTPGEYSIRPGGDAVKMYAQCYLVTNHVTAESDGTFIQFGTKDKTIYISRSAPEGQSAFIITPVDDKPTKYTLRAWFTVGLSNTPWDSGSYGVMNLTANSDTKTFEFTVAGIGLGYCGAQLKSDGNDIYAETSVDMGTSCTAIESACAKATDISDSNTCSDDLKAFSLMPIGRIATQGSTQAFGASQYPAAPNLTFDGSRTDLLHAFSSDDVAPMAVDLEVRR
jgi:hypothetical protein